MSVITISRQAGSQGNEVAARVCKVLAYKHFDKSMIAEAAKEAGLLHEQIIDYSEENRKMLTFLDRLLGRSTPVAQTRVWKESVSGVRTVEDITLNEDVVVALVEKAIRTAHEYGNMVIIGRGSQIILRDRPDVLHVRITAPLELRIQYAKKQLKAERQSFDASIDLRRDAQDWIQARDAASADYLKTYYNVDWNDCSLYHLMLNMGRMTVEQAADTIVHLSQTMSFPEKQK